MADINVTEEIIDINVTEEVINIIAPLGGYPLPNTINSVFGRVGNIVATEGDYTLTQLGDVTLTSPANGQVLKYNGTQWVNSTDADTGITTLNTLTALNQTFATGTSGTNFNISSATSTHTFNLPVASAANTGKLSSTDWSTFNNKQNAVTLTTTGTSGAATFVSGVLNIPQYQGVLTNPITGTGTSEQVAFFNGTNSITSNAAFAFTTTSQLLVNNSVTAASAIARGTNLTPTLIAAANSDVLVGLDINSTFTNGAFTGVTNLSIRTSGLIASNNGGFYGGFVANSNRLGNNNYSFVSHSPNSGVANQIYSGSRPAVPVTTAIIHYVGTDTQVYWDTTNAPYNFLISGSQALKLFTTRNLLLQDGGTFTDAGFRLDVNGTARVQGVLTTTANASVNGVSVGRGSGNIATTTAIGSSAGNANTTGAFNTFIGASAGATNSTANQNTFVGFNAGTANSTGASNTILGTFAGQSNTTGNNNIFIGVNTGASNTTGTANTFIGREAGFSNLTGSQNVMLGQNAGRYITGGVTSNTIANNSIFLGFDTRAAADNQTNQIVIGFQTTGLGSNTTIIGNNATTLTALYGSVIVNGTSINASSVLQADSTTQGFLPPRMTTTQKNAISSPATGLVVFDTTLGKLCVFSGTWQTITSV